MWAGCDGAKGDAGLRNGCVGKLTRRRPRTAHTHAELRFYRGPQSDLNRHCADFKNGLAAFRELGKRFAEALILTARQRF
ncbi:Uncharacterised protein [Mycolicibacterium vanbaalenii]|uniref:Uncharacterized protein n=1 Tax=Mycolicibacterium vanbaalenii TaxID=110539 RepID=A0A5S9R638_MYCVN|nr:Uncharacterised protein [Mycolicibacterium vanbaalenii]